GEDAGASDATADGGAADDDVAFVTYWGFPLEAVRAPVRIVHGRLDRVIPVSHAAALGRLMPHAVVTIHDEDGHVSVLEHLEQHLRAVLA
ncbi:MAG: alpha/beta hydrolase, partial [Cryobacterium sp.]|nr:alpha/beta hydrolase [Cryobacterium sp.]